MRNILILFCCLLLLLSFSKKSKEVASNQTPPQGYVIYQFSHIKDTNNLGNMWKEQMMLVFNEGRTLYLSYSSMQQDSLLNAKSESAQKDENGVYQIQIHNYKPTTREKIYTNLMEKIRYLVESFSSNNYIINEPIENIDWQIKKDIKKIAGYTCQKAVGMCKGREYTAWFTTDIPARFGPWKLHGLPGLILEAYDANKWISFTCIKAVIGNSVLSTYSSFEVPAGVSTTQAKYQRMVNVYREGISNNSSNDDGIKVTSVKLNGNNGSSRMRSKFTVNYPLELKN